jgi:hypothetical protein
LKTQETLYGLLKGYAEDLDQPALAADALTSLVSTIGRIRELAPSLVSKQTWWFENLELGGVLEGLGRLEGASRAYQTAIEADSSMRAQFLPDLGRIRIAVRARGKTPQLQQECDKWRMEISSPTYKIDERTSGGLDLAQGRVDFSCGNNRAARIRIQRVILKRPSWDEPYRVLGEMLRAEGESKEASKAFTMARQVKEARDAESLERIVRDARAILAAP